MSLFCISMVLCENNRRLMIHQRKRLNDFDEKDYPVMAPVKLKRLTKHENVCQF